MQQKHDRGRFSAKRKADAVLCLLRGEELRALSRELGVTAATLSAWRADISMRNELLRERCHQLFDIPFVIRRATIYALLTAGLAGLYALIAA